MTAGKGSKPRPMDIPRDEYENNWQKIFPSKRKPPEEPKK